MKGRLRQKGVRKILHWIIILVAAYAVLCVAVFFLQGKLLYHPVRELEVDPSRVRLAFEDVRLVAEDGVELHGWYVPGPGEGKARGTVLFCHGNGGNISHRLETVRLLHELGLAVFLFDYRGYGKSAGKPSEAGTRLDALAAWDWLAREKQVEPGEIILWGRSLGGAVAAKLASEHTPGVLILESTFTSVPDVGAKAYPGLPIRLLSRYRYDTLGLLQEIQCPILVIHSREDKMVWYGFGARLFEQAPEPKRFLEISGGHNSGFLLSGAVYTEGVDAFLAEFFDARD